MSNVKTVPEPSVTVKPETFDRYIPLTKVGADMTVCSVLCIGRTKAGEIIKEPDFPKPIDLGGSCYRYKLSEVVAWAEAHRRGACEA